MKPGRVTLAFRKLPTLTCVARAHCLLCCHPPLTAILRSSKYPDAFVTSSAQTAPPQFDPNFCSWSPNYFFSRNLVKVLEGSIQGFRIYGLTQSQIEKCSKKMNRIYTSYIDHIWTVLVTIPPNNRVQRFIQHCI